MLHHRHLTQWFSFWQSALALAACIWGAVLALAACLGLSCMHMRGYLGLGCVPMGAALALAAYPGLGTMPTEAALGLAACPGQNFSIHYSMISDILRQEQETGTYFSRINSIHGINLKAKILSVSCHNKKN